MDSNYTALNNAVNTAITTHLLTVNTLPPNADIPVWSKTITEIVFDTLKAGGLGQERIEELGQGTLAQAKVQGR